MATVSSQSAIAVTYYWDTNDTAAGSGNATGTWDSSVSALFTQTANGTATTTANTTTSSDTLTFSAGNGGASVAQQNGTPGTITVSGTQTIGTMALNQSDLVFTGGTINATTAFTVNANATIGSALNTSNNIQFQTAGKTLTLSGGGSDYLTFNANSAATALTSTIILSSGTLTSSRTGSNLMVNVGNATAETGGLIINNGASMTYNGTSSFQVGNGSEGLLTVNAGGAFSNTNTANLLIGRGVGSGKLLVNGGNVVSATPVSIGFAATSNSTINTVTVSSGNLSTSSDIGIGVGTTAATGTLTNSVLNISGGTVKTGAARGVIFGGATGLTNSSFGTGTLNMTGGTLYVGTGGIAKTGTGSYAIGGINVSGGIIGAQGNWSSNLTMNLGTTNGPVTFQSGNQTGTGFNITLSGNLTGAGGLTKTGSGNLVLGGSNSYSGNTTITSGTLVLAGAGTLQSALGDLALSGGSLTASVASTTFGGNITLSSSGILDTATAGVGTFNLADGKTFSMSGGTWNLNITGDSTFDKIVSVSGTPSFSITAGTIDLTGGTINYLTTYGILSGFSSGTVGGLSIQGYDSTNYLAILGADGILAFTAIPEPGTWVLVALAGLVLAAVRVRAKKTV